jgi:serine phosphatase RsbU (regulator of sigma subunit)
LSQEIRVLSRVAESSDPESTTPGREIDVVLIEDEAGDAVLVQELIEEHVPEARVTWVTSMAEAGSALGPETRCVLLDLGLPDAVGWSSLKEVQALSPVAAVVVLTGLDDEQRGLESVALGAQDYLAKGRVDGQLLRRSIRYALERKTSELTRRRLAQAEAWGEENARLERGLLPQPVLRDLAWSVSSLYRPGRSRALLGGDFFDVVECEDGRLVAVIGDVSGHGPDEAALGVCLRVAWRTLVLGGASMDSIFPTLSTVLAHERPMSEVFATVCMVRIDATARILELWLAGHPPPHLLGMPAIDGYHRGLPLGLDAEEVWRSLEVPLGVGWSLMLFTDGLIEGRVDDGADRLGIEGLAGLVEECSGRFPAPDRWLEELVSKVQVLNGGTLADDLAVLVISHT